jgi:hypothetical protein
VPKAARHQVHARIHEQGRGVENEPERTVHARTRHLPVVEHEVGDAVPRHIRYADGVESRDHPVGEVAKRFPESGESLFGKRYRHDHVPGIDHHRTSAAEPLQDGDVQLATRRDIEFEIGLAAAPQHHHRIGHPIDVHAGPVIGAGGVDDRVVVGVGLDGQGHGGGSLVTESYLVD